MSAIRVIKAVQVACFAWAVMFGLLAVAMGLAGYFDGFRKCALICLANVGAYLLNGVTLRRLRRRAA